MELNIEPDEGDAALSEMFNVDPLPAYLMLEEGPLKEEARRVHVLELLRLAVGDTAIRLGRVVVGVEEVAAGIGVAPMLGPISWLEYTHKPPRGTHYAVSTDQQHHHLRRSVFI